MMDRALDEVLDARFSDDSESQGSQEFEEEDEED